MRTLVKQSQANAAARAPIYLVTESDARLSTSGLGTSWEQLMLESVITQDQPFTLRGLKYRGFMDTKGWRRRSRSTKRFGVPAVAPARAEAFAPPKPWL